MVRTEKGIRIVILLVTSMLLSSIGVLTTPDDNATTAPEIAATPELTNRSYNYDSSHGTTQPFGNHTYNLIKSRATWDQAQLAANNAGGYLAIVENASEDAFLLNLLISGGVRSTANDGGGAKYGWLGGNDSTTEGDWVWNDGSLINNGYDHWGSGAMGSEPDDAGGQDCLALGMETWPVGVGSGQGFGDSGEWNDVDCSNSLAYIIEFDPPPATFTTNVTVHPSIDETVLIPHDNTTRITAFEFDFEGSPMRQEMATGFNQQQLIANSSTANSSSDNITFSSSGIQLGFLDGGSAGISGAGNGTLNVAGTLNLSGNHSYDNIHISGYLDSMGPVLQLTANTISIDNGGIIHSNHSSGGPGRGAGGNYTGTTGTGGNGAAHIGAGGSGGGNTNTTNMSYGIGNETGSQGGNVTNTNGNGNVRAVGGLGGGVIILIARDIYINGTISVKGNDGENAPNPTGGGAGVAGAGGGSGGSLIIIADNIWWGQNGAISAAGGDGGDGSNGARRTGGPSLMQYDGGDGGGGGGGGNVNITTMLNGVIGQPSISVLGGFGGTGGAPYRQGAHGRAGGSGANGLATTTSNFSGLGGNGGRALGGEFTTGALGHGGLSEGSTIRIGSVVPNGTNLSGSIRITLDSGANANWGAWEPLNLTEHWLERSRFFQLKFQLNTTSNRTTPTITNISYETWWWAALEGSNPLGFSIDDRPIGSRDWQAGNPGGIEPLYGNPLRLFHSDSFYLATTSTFNPYTGSIVISVPVEAVPDDGWILLHSDSGTTPNLVTLSIGTIDLPSVDIQTYSRDIALPGSELTTVWPSSGTIDASGIEWGELSIDWSADNRTLTNVGELSIPWNFTKTVGINGEFVSSINNMVQSECVDWYHFRECRDNFPLITTGSSTNQQFPIKLTNLNITTIDDIEPRLLDVWMEVTGSRTNSAEYGDLLSFSVSDQIGENNLLINCTVTPIGGSSSPSQSMYFDWTAKVYRQNIYSDDYASPDSETNLIFECQMTDIQNNTANPSPYLQVTIHPVAPTVSSLSISSESGPLSGNSTSGEWRHDELLLFVVEEENNRSDLNVFITLSATDSPDIDIPLSWNESGNSYNGEWTAGLTNLGGKDLEVTAEDTVRGRIDSDGLITGVDATLIFLDKTPPEILDVSFGWADSDQDAWRTTVTWSAEPGESVNGWVHVYDEGNVEIKTIYILEVNSTAGYVDFNTTDLEPGYYQLEVTLFDASNNSANDWKDGMDGELIIESPVELNINILSPLEGSTFIVGVNITIELEISCSAGCSMNLVEAGLTELTNGTININLSLVEVGNLRYFFTLSSGASTERAILNITVSSPPIPQFESPVCNQIEPTIIGGDIELSCVVNNIGVTDAFTRVIILSSDPLITCQPTTGVMVPSNTTMVGGCVASGNVSVSTTVSGAFAFEWQDVEGAWHRIGGLQQFNAILEPAETIRDDTNITEGNNQAESSESGLPLLLAGTGIFLLLIFLITGMFVLRSKRHSKDSTIDSDLGFQATTDQDNDAIEPDKNRNPLETTPPLMEPESNATISGFVQSYEQLPPGGRYQQVPEGLWYIDNEERWWWQEADSGWRRQ